jgi:hypothetical protein
LAIVRFLQGKSKDGVLSDMFLCTLGVGQSLFEYIQKIKSGGNNLCRLISGILKDPCGIVPISADLESSIPIEAQLRTHSFFFLAGQILSNGSVDEFERIHKQTALNHAKFIANVIYPCAKAETDLSIEITTDPLLMEKGDPVTSLNMESIKTSIHNSIWVNFEETLGRFGEVFCDDNITY